MVKKLFVIAVVTALGLQASGIDLKMADANPKRVAPTNGNEVISYSGSVKDAMRSIVNISTKKHATIAQNLNPLFNDPFFKEFFGDRFGQLIPKERVERALGSGVILSADGYIVTNNHVVANADEIIVNLSNDDKEYSAKMIGRDPDSDIAVIKIEEKNLHPIKLGDSSKLQVGDVVFALGNPFGVGESATYGIISALNKNKVGINRYENFIQTDASINPGNSGGALIDSRGALIGINTAILSRSGGNHGIGFAIPINMVKNIVTKLAEDGKIIRGYMGVNIKDLDKNLKEVYKHTQGAIVVNVEKDSPAEKAGVKRGDLIYEMNGKRVKDARTLSNITGGLSPSQKVTLKIERDGYDKKLTIKLGSRDNLLASSGEKVLGGIILSDISREESKRFRLPSTIKGALIKDVEPRSKAEKAGFEAGDVIVQVEGMVIKSTKDVGRALSKYASKKYKRVYVNRYGNILMFVSKE
jgi:serine protease Do